MHHLTWNGRTNIIMTFFRPLTLYHLFQRLQNFHITRFSKLQHTKSHAFNIYFYCCSHMMLHLICNTLNNEVIERSTIFFLVKTAYKRGSISVVTWLRSNWNRLSLMSAGGGRNRMKCCLGLARSSGTESSRRPPRVVDALVASLLSISFQPKWDVRRARCLFHERLISHFDSF